MSFEQLVKVTKKVKLRQPRVYVLSILKLPEEIRDKTPQRKLINSQGTILLGFSSFPFKGMYFPYEGNIWEIHHSPIQLPVRYYSRQPKHSAIIVPKWVDNYNDFEEMIEKLISLD